MSEGGSDRPARRRSLRFILWLILAGIAFLFLVNLFVPDFDLSGEDRIALVRVEGVILDAQQTVTELKKYGENPLVKGVVLRIDSPGGGVVPSQEIHDAVLRVRNKNS